jgi:DNA-binding response OmpR family regulator
MNGDGKILVVDDVPQNVRLLEAVLVPRGYDVVTATDGDSALTLIESEEPDLVLLDVVMPELDGYEVCRRLRAREETAMLPVLMVTASVAEKAKVIEAGADDLIAKPFNQDEMLARVRSLLRIKRYHDTVKAQAAELLGLNRSLEGSKDVCRRRSRSSSGCGSCDGSCRRNWPTPSSRRATTRSCVVTVVRSRCSSPTCAAGRASWTPSNPRS